jgi:hypothetical protein
MRIREENCNMVLLAAITLLSVMVAGTATWLEPAATGNKKPVLASSATTPSPAEQPVRLFDQTPVRVVGAPFVPNTNPRQR